MTAPGHAVPARIAVYLLTGFLGSGKTTLLRAWLQQPALLGAALIINELGEVSLDDRLIPNAAETTSLLANACVCCSGLPGLEEAMAGLFWARLQRKIAPFTSLVIETTGMADPLPVIAALQADALLRQRYALAGVITTLSATAGLEALRGYSEASNQLLAANVVVLSKVDRVDATKLQTLRQRVAQLAPQAQTLVSAQASLSAQEVLAWLPGMQMPTPPQNVTRANAGLQDHLPIVPRHKASHQHGAEAVFMAMPQPQTRSALWAQLVALQRQQDCRMLRIKGLVLITGAELVSVQWALGDDGPEIAPYASADAASLIAAGPLGLTLIRERLSR